MKNQQSLIGFRVSYARKQLRVTQEELSKHLGFKDRQILSNIENGNRAVSAEELIKIMQVTGRNLEFFTDSFIIAGETEFSFRAKADTPFLNEFQEKAEKLLGTYKRLSELEGHYFSYFSKKLRITERSSYEDALKAGEKLSEELGLGNIPAENLQNRIEDDLNILLLFLDAPNDISGAACHLQSFDSILINRNEYIGRINYDISHELFHLLTWESMQPNRIDDKTNFRCEQLANKFASAFLMPEKSLKIEWERRKRMEINKRLNATATFFNVTAKALKWRIINLGWLDDSQKKNINDNLLIANGEPKKPLKKPLLFSKKFVARLYLALENGNISARRAANLTGLSLEELLHIFKEYKFKPPFDL